jgi:hypothetical protein
MCVANMLGSAIISRPEGIDGLTTASYMMAINQVLKVTAGLFAIGVVYVVDRRQSAAYESSLKSTTFEQYVVE